MRPLLYSSGRISFLDGVTLKNLAILSMGFDKDIYDTEIAIEQSKTLTKLSEHCPVRRTKYKKYSSQYD